MTTVIASTICNRLFRSFGVEFSLLEVKAMTRILADDDREIYAIAKNGKVFVVKITSTNDVKIGEATFSL